MNLQLAIRCIGISHLLQPPLTLLLARKLGLRRAFACLPPSASLVVHNMAVASVALPTSAGLIVALGAEDVAHGGALRYLAWLLVLFWTWRLSRQLRLASLLPTPWHWGLSAIFSVQGPLLGILLVWTAWR